MTRIARPGATPAIAAVLPNCAPSAAGDGLAATVITAARYGVWYNVCGEVKNVIGVGNGGVP